MNAKTNNAVQRAARAFVCLLILICGATQGQAGSDKCELSYAELVQRIAPAVVTTTLKSTPISSTVFGVDEERQFDAQAARDPRRSASWLSVTIRVVVSRPVSKLR